MDCQLRPARVLAGRAGPPLAQGTGLAPNLASISPARTRFHFQGKLRRNLPFAITARTVAGARRAAPNDLTFSAWAASEFGKHTAVALTGLAGASFSYHHEPGELAADFVWTRLQRLFLPPAVHRVVGGWSTIIGLLAVHADRRGVVIETGHRIEHLLRFEHGFLCRLEDRIKATDDAHRQNDIGILAALEQVAQNIVSDSPDEGDNSVVCRLIHYAAILENMWS